MMPALKAELRKLFTVRTTYVVSGLLLLVLAGVAFWFGGYNASDQTLSDPNLISNALLNGISQVAVVGALVAILLVTHEYRYNTILYSLTGNSRSKVLAAKFAAISMFSVLYVIVAALVSVGALMLGAQLQDGTLVSQTLPMFDLIWRILFYAWAYALFGLIAAVLIRNQVATLVIVLFLAGTIEGLLSLVLKDNAAYLPFTALSLVIVPDQIAAFVGGTMSSAKAAIITAGYLLAGTTAAWLSFMKRDAN